MHLKEIRLHPEKYPTEDHCPLDLPVFREERTITLTTPVSFFVGENGRGRSTRVEAIARKTRIHIREDGERRRLHDNPEMTGSGTLSIRLVGDAG